MSGINGISTVILAADGDYSRLFGLDPQLLMDACITAVAVFVLVLFLSKLLQRSEYQSADPALIFHTASYVQAAGSHPSGTYHRSVS